MSGGGGSKEVKTVTQGNTSSEPWKPSQANLKYGLGEAKDLYKSGQGFDPYMGSTVVPYAQQTMQALGGMEGNANLYQGDLQKPLEAYSQQLDYLNPIAGGDFTNDPTFNQTLGAAQRDARYNVDLGASGAGRYGSAVHQGNVAREVGELTNRAMLDRQRWAQGALGQATQGLGQAYGMSMMPYDTMRQVGGYGEDLMGRQMNDQLRIFNEQQAAPLSALQNFMALSSGAGALGGTGTSRSAQTSPNTNYTSPASSAFGNALTGYAMGGLPGAALGGLSGLF